MLQSEIEIALLKKDVEFLKAADAEEKAKIKALEQELTELKETYNNLVAKGSGVMAAIVALGAVIAWVLNALSIFKK